MNMTSAHCPICHERADVVAELPSHNGIRAHELDCGHAYLLDSQMTAAAVSVDQWHAALAQCAWVSLIDLNLNRTPSFQRLCAQFNAARSPRYGEGRYIIVNTSERI